ncbi:hypothetical protein HOLleu_41017 [Holothuria leucospilota]|uniref:Uncharacterized protein n=1 Tax=Holothuria leucospilota TaxID=206669 RepID=A0A9Q0YIM5_HOLLE|nr:hypothetical protein HOLleu_41017 [Holothuria leucospilota]
MVAASYAYAGMVSWYPFIDGSSLLCLLKNGVMGFVYNPSPHSILTLYPTGILNPLYLHPTSFSCTDPGYGPESTFVRKGVLISYLFFFK